MFGQFAEEPAAGAPPVPLPVDGVVLLEEPELPLAALEPEDPLVEDPLVEDPVLDELPVSLVCA